MVKNPPANAGATRDSGKPESGRFRLWNSMCDSIPGSGTSSGEGNGNPLQDSCLGNPTDSGAWLAGYSPWGHTESEATQQSSNDNQY